MQNPLRAPFPQICQNMTVYDRGLTRCKELQKRTIGRFSGRVVGCGGHWRRIWRGAVSAKFGEFILFFLALPFTWQCYNIARRVLWSSGMTRPSHGRGPGFETPQDYQYDLPIRWIVFAMAGPLLYPEQ